MPPARVDGGTCRKAKQVKYGIYVGTYAKYNNGNLAGAWIDPTDFLCRSDFIDACKELHKGEKDPELMFLDWEGEYWGLISEGCIDGKFWEFINSPELRNDQRKAAFTEFVHYGFTDLDLNASDILEDFAERYKGEYKNEEEFAAELAIEEFAEEFERNSNLEMYFDYSAYARDRFVNDYVYLNGFVFARY